MTLTGPAHRSPARPHSHMAAHTRGYLIAIALNIIFLYVVNVWPGWQAWAFLTPETPQFLSLLNFALVAGIAINAAFILFAASWFKALGDFLATAIALAVLLRAWQVFPFDFTGWAVLLTHAALVVAIVATVIGMTTSLVLLERHIMGKGVDDD